MDANQNTFSDNHKPLNPFVTGVAGAFIGIGVTALTAKILSDKKMKGKIMDTASDISNKTIKLLRNKAADTVEKFSHEISRLREPARKRIAIR